MGQPSPKQIPARTLRRRPKTSEPPTPAHPFRAGRTRRPERCYRGQGVLSGDLGREHRWSRGGLHHDIDVRDGAFASDIGITIPNVKSGERKSKRFGPYTTEYARKLIARITDYDISHSITATPITASTGETAALQSGIKFAINGVNLQNGFFYTGQDVTKYALARENAIFAVLSVSVKEHQQ